MKENHLFRVRNQLKEPDGIFRSKKPLQIQGVTKFCEGLGITQSMSRVGYPYDNDPIELIDMDRIQWLWGYFVYFAMKSDWISLAIHGCYRLDEDGGS